MLPTIEEINFLLEKVHKYIDNGNVDFIKGFDEKYLLGHLGISFRDAIGMARNLTYENYYRGPSPDHDTSSDGNHVWEFGIEDVPDNIYIKLKFRTDKDELLFMSFHYEKRKMFFPFRNKKQE